MTKLLEPTLEIQIRRLRNTAICIFLIGANLDYEMLLHHHHMWALLIAIITLQATAGSLIIRNDLKNDLHYSKESCEKA